MFFYFFIGVIWRNWRISTLFSLTYLVEAVDQFINIDKGLKLLEIFHQLIDFDFGIFRDKFLPEELLIAVV